MSRTDRPTYIFSICLASSLYSRHFFHFFLLPLSFYFSQYIHFYISSQIVVSSAILKNSGPSKTNLRMYLVYNLLLYSTLVTSFNYSTFLVILLFAICTSILLPKPPFTSLSLISLSFDD